MKGSCGIVARGRKLEILQGRRVVVVVKGKFRKKGCWGRRLLVGVVSCKGVARKKCCCVVRGLEERVGKLRENEGMIVLYQESSDPKVLTTSQ